MADPGDERLAEARRKAFSSAVSCLLGTSWRPGHSGRPGRAQFGGCGVTARGRRSGPRWKTPADAPVEVLDLGQVEALPAIPRVFTLRPGLDLTFVKAADGRFTVHSRSGVPAAALAGLPSRARVARSARPPRSR
jgi:hypothetical protein